MKRIHKTLAGAVIAGLSLLAVAGSLSLGDKREARSNGLTVHEWGTFTSVASADGVQRRWQPLRGPTDLPKFVHFNTGLLFTKATLDGTVRMETPVLYFYTDRAMDVAVKIAFPKGNITEVYPKANLVSRGILWPRVRVTPNAQVEFPVEKMPSHYYPARETDAAPLEVRYEWKDQQGKATEIIEREKLLFYRGIGTFDQPVAIQVVGNGVRLTNRTSHPIGRVILFERDGDRAGYRIAHLRNETTVTRPSLHTGGGSPDAELIALLTERGLYEKEARAMLKTWLDTWFEDGLRVLYVVPTQTTDELLPIEIEPKPAALTRVLVGRMEILTPEREQAIARAVHNLDTASADARSAAAALLRRENRFGQPIIDRAVAANDLETQYVLRILLSQL